jgi:hypothetical protein
MDASITTFTNGQELRLSPHFTTVALLVVINLRIRAATDFMKLLGRRAVVIKTVIVGRVTA